MGLPGPGRGGPADRTALTENTRLRTSAQALSATVERLSRHLDEFESRTRRLAVAAGFSRRGAGGVGGPLETSRTGARWPIARGSALVAQLDELETRLADREALLASIPTVPPVRGVVNSGFGSRSWSGAYGKLVEISHPTGYQTLYGHLDIVFVRERERVARGTGSVSPVQRVGRPARICTTRFGSRGVP